ncbi:MAG: carbohydrate-binding domain-containing protein [Lachnospiraceae bacterium]|nr:carbohydrate-binding domain-containing protein [Lachnospiraceae bacterium]
MFCCAMLALNLMGCSNSSDGKDSASTGTDTQQEVISVEIDPSEMFSDRDLKADYQLDSCVKIQLNGDVAQCDSDGVNVDGSTVTIEKEGTYLVSGTLTNGSIKVDTDKEAKVQIVLDAVSIQNDSSAALYVKQADKVFLTLAENTENTQYFLTHKISKLISLIFDMTIFLYYHTYPC